MSFDSLQFQGFAPPSTSLNGIVNKHCNTCNTDMEVEAAVMQCPLCSTNLENIQSTPAVNSNVPQANPNMNIQAMMMQMLASSLGMPEGILNGGGNMAELMQAQQGMNLEELMQQTLQASAPSVGTSRDFLKMLIPRPLHDGDFVQIRLTTEGLQGDIFPTSSVDLGRSLIDAHLKAEPSSDNQKHLFASLELADPLKGKGGFQNSQELKGKIVITQRGDISFAVKANQAEQNGAVALIVIQTGDIWPYLMTDSAKVGQGLTIPCLMISSSDGNKLKSRVESQGVNEKKLGGVHMTIHTSVQSLECCVCRCDFELKEEAVQLPCTHYFHIDCIKPWLEKQHTCPLCRYKLPTEEKLKQTSIASQMAASMYS